MKTNKPCKYCPCKPTTAPLHRGIIRSKYEEIVASGGFPCHERHPDGHALIKEALGEDGKFHTTDCAGYKIWGLDKGETT